MARPSVSMIGSVKAIVHAQEIALFTSIVRENLAALIAANLPCFKTLTAQQMRLLTLEAPTSAHSIASALETVLAPSGAGARELPAAPPPCPLPASSMRARTLWAPTDAPLTLTAKARELAQPTTGARERRDAKLSSP